jgi:transcription antitermination factor NusG
VVVLSGPFTGLEGVFQRYVPSRERCRILLEAVGKLATVELPEWDLQEAKEGHQLGAA